MTLFLIPIQLKFPLEYSINRQINLNIGKVLNKVTQSDSTARRDLAYANTRLAAKAAAVVTLFFALAAEARTQTLAEAVALMFDNYPQIKVAELQVEERDADIALQKSLRRPSLSLGLRGGEERFTRTDRDDQAFGELGSANLNGRQLLYDGGKTRNSILEANHLRNHSQRSLDEARQTLALKLTGAYIDVLKFRTLEEMAERNIRDHREVLAQTARKANQGAAPKADIALVRARLSKAQSTLQSRRQQLGAALNTYHMLTGTYPGLLSQPEFPEWALPVSYDDNDFTLNPGYRSARERLLAAEAKHKSARSSRSPSLSFAVQGDASDGARYNALREDISALLVLNYDIFDGGEKRTRIQLSATQILKEEWNVKNELLAAESEYFDAMNALNSAEQRLLQLRDYETSMREVVSAYQRQFELGKRGLLNVLDVKNELFSVESSIEEAQQSRLQSAYRVLSATGELIPALQQESLPNPQ